MAPSFQKFEATSEAASAMGRGNTKSDTKPEKQLRSLLHRSGYRFRKNYLIRIGSAKARPDIVFTKQKIAVFIDGCFWHLCPEHGNIPKSNTRYWKPKLMGNVERDARTDKLLKENGWRVIRIWEHTPVVEAAEHVVRIIEKCRGQ